MKFEIDRAKWLHGKAILSPAGDSKIVTEASSLLHPDTGCMCCLGFFGLAIGLTRDQIRGMGEPSEIELNHDQTSPWPTELVGVFEGDDEGYAYIRARDTRVCSDLIEANDESEIGQDLATFRADKETAIAKLFASIGYEAVFVGEYADHGTPTAPPLDDSAVRDALIDDEPVGHHRDSREEQL
jgi:hypothetical protein